MNLKTVKKFLALMTKALGASYGKPLIDNENETTTTLGVKEAIDVVSMTD